MISGKAYLPSENGEALLSPNLESRRNWFAAHTVPRHEKRIEEHLRVREIECFLPSYQSLRHWRDGSRRMIRFPLFPNYVFVHICPQERTSVRRIPGVISIVGNASGPLPVDESYINALEQSLRCGKKLEPYPYLHTGDRVRICSGLMAGLEGVLVRKKDNVNRVAITLELIRSSIIVEVATEDCTRL